MSGPRAHTGTFRGNQLAFATGAEAVRIVSRDDVLGNVRCRGEQIARAAAVLRRPVGANGPRRMRRRPAALVSPNSRSSRSAHPRTRAHV